MCAFHVMRNDRNDRHDGNDGCVINSQSIVTKVIAYSWKQKRGQVDRGELGVIDLAPMRCV